MRRSIVLLVTFLAVLPAPAGAQEALLHVDDGNFFYDVDGDCVGDTDVAAGATALRHWHVGLPLVGAEAEVAAGFGCLGGPKTFGPIEGPVSVTGSIRYTWDTNVPGGCCNDVHLHVYDAEGSMVFSTLDADGYQPVIPMALQIRSHEFSFTLGAGTYTFVEDVFAGEHSAWLTKLAVVAA